MSRLSIFIFSSTLTILKILRLLLLKQSIIIHYQFYINADYHLLYFEANFILTIDLHHNCLLPIPTLLGLTDFQCLVDISFQTILQSV